MTTLFKSLGKWSSVGLLIFSFSAFASDTLRLCVSDSNWHPFVIIENGNVSGAYIDILMESIKAFPLDIEFIPIPWKRCLQLTESGDFDGIAGVSYQDKRAKFLSYPSDTHLTDPSSFHLSQVNYVVVTMNNIDFDIFKLDSKRESYCADNKTDWNERKIKEVKTNKEQELILKAQEKIKKEHSVHFGFKELMQEQDNTECLTHNLWGKFMQMG